MVHCSKTATSQRCIASCGACQLSYGLSGACCCELTLVLPLCISATNNARYSQLQKLYEAAPWTKPADSVADSAAEASESAASCGVANSEHAAAATLGREVSAYRPLEALFAQLDSLV